MKEPREAINFQEEPKFLFRVAFYISENIIVEKFRGKIKI
jgi:hypothetical protein